jgi:cysteine desulfurase
MRRNHTVYMDYQATTPIDPGVLSVMEESYRTEFGNPHSMEHEIGWSAAAAVAQAADNVAAFVGARSDWVTWTSGASEANVVAILGAAAGAPSGRSQILVSAAEHKSVASAAEAASHRFDCESIVLDVDASGCVREETLARHLSDAVLLVSIMAVNNEVGGINDIMRLGALARGAGALFHVDASQAAAACDVSELSHDADLITLSAHKAYGPKGVGALIAAPAIVSELRPLSYAGGQQNLRPGTIPVALCKGFAEALRLIAEKGAAERERVAALRALFLAGLQHYCGEVELIGPALERRHPGNACVRFVGIDASDLIAAMQPRLAASTQAACNSGSLEPSPVLMAIGLDRQAASECVRFSLGRFSSEDQVEDAIAVLSALVTERRSTINALRARG